MGQQNTEAGLERMFTAKQLEEAGFGSQPTLARNRMRGSGIPFVYVGRQVRYRASDVQAWVDANRKTHALQRPPHHKGGRPKVKR